MSASGKFVQHSESFPSILTLIGQFEEGLLDRRRWGVMPQEYY
ncbi:hypothetical protein NSPZN2_30631 [Nitrospira defluvii]|uniref:Transposase n=1 Tax=Nitrospira defluvii TaxID=330214 RepID=A0ABN7LU94_9BACT|nr:hypothetical protein NSPZN2_30631 [Nitrospira defluvii]